MVRNLSLRLALLDRQTLCAMVLSVEIIRYGLSESRLKFTISVALCEERGNNRLASAGD